MTSSNADRPSLWFLVSPRWILFHLVVLAGIVLMVNLGFWQLDRLDQRRAHNAAVEERYDAPVQALGELLPAGDREDPNDPSLATLEWLPVSVSGEYIPRKQVQIVNRSQDGSPGWQALTPLALDDGRVLLVNRGFVPLDRESAEPTGRMRLEGHLRVSQGRHFGGLEDPETGALSSAQRIDIDRLGPQFGAPVVPMYLELSRSTPDGQVDGLPAPVRPPTIDEGNHFSYALQWFCFAGAVAVGWFLAVRNSIRRRRGPRSMATESVPSEAAPHDTPPPVGASTSPAPPERVPHDQASGA